MNDLWITTYLGFLGGTLNSTATLGTVHITGSEGFGATANLSPEANPITLGSTISLEGLGDGENGSGMAIYCGDYTIKNAADFITGEFCSTVVGNQPLNPNPAVQTTIVGFEVEEVLNGGKNYSKFITDEGGECDFRRDFNGKVKLSNHGRMSIQAGARVTLEDPIDGTIASVTVFDAGVFTIADSSFLIAPNKVVVGVNSVPFTSAA